MKKLIITQLLIVFAVGSMMDSNAQTITDYDGNVYQTVTIDDQVWMKENLKSLHYADGTPINGVLSYNNDDNLAEIYGRLYNWNATMNNSNQEEAQGVCPDEWHVPAIGEWANLSQYLGGDNIAGGKMKEEGTEHWLYPNTGATNESGFTGLPAGEKYDNTFWLMGKAAVLWSSSETSSTYAEYRYLSHDDAKLGYYNYYKSYYYSVRCVKNTTTGIKKNTFHGIFIYPNPFDQLIFFEQKETNQKSQVIISMYNQFGQLITGFTLQSKLTKKDFHDFAPGIYFVKLEFEDRIEYQKVLKK